MTEFYLKISYNILKYPNIYLKLSYNLVGGEHFQPLVSQLILVLFLFIPLYFGGEHFQNLNPFHYSSLFKLIPCFIPGFISNCEK